MASDLKSKVVDSGSWIFLSQIFDQGLGFIRLLILARILSPVDFGLVGMAWLVLQILTTFTQTGVQHVLIYKKKYSIQLMNTSWSFLILRGLGLYFIVYLIAPLIGLFFNESAIVNIVRVLSVSLILEGITNIGIVNFRKDLQFQKQFVYQVSGSIIDFAVTIIFAFILQDVWAIVIGLLAGGITRLIVSYILSSFRPKFEFNRDNIKEIASYGKWIFGSNILQFLYSQGDDILVGKILGTTQLGLYQLSYRISNMPATQVTHIISTVMFSAYSKLQNDLSQLSNAYLRSFQLTVFLSFFVGTGIILFAEEFVIVFLGNQWLPMVRSMQILTVWGVLRSIAATTGPLWQALGTPKIMTQIQLLHVIILAILILPFILMWEIVGASLAVVVSALIPYAVALIMVSRTTLCSIQSLLRELVFPICISTAVAFIIIALKTISFSTNIINLVGMSLFYTVLYLILYRIADVIFHMQIYVNVIRLVSKAPLLSRLIKVR